MKIKRIAHMGIGCKGNQEVRKLYADNLDLAVASEEMVGELKITFVPVGETNMELVQSTTGRRGDRQIRRQKRRRHPPSGL